MECSVLVDSTPKFYPTIDGNSVIQLLAIFGTSCPLVLHGVIMCAKISDPKQKDYDALSTFEMSSS